MSDTQHGAHVPEKINLMPTPVIPPKGAFSIANHSANNNNNNNNQMMQSPSQSRHEMEKVQQQMAAIIRENSPHSNKNVEKGEGGGSHMVYPYHNKTSPRRGTLNLQSRMNKLEPKSLKSPSSTSRKNYRNALFLPKSKEPTGFLRSSNRFGAKPAYEPPETKDYIVKTNINYQQSPRRLLTNVGVRRPNEEREDDTTLTLYEERQDPDRHSIPVRTAQTVLTAEKKRQYRHPRNMEDELIKYEKQNALLTKALGNARRELVVTKEKLSKSEAKLSKSNEKVNTLLVLVQDILHRWVQKQQNSNSENDDNGISSLLNNNEKIFQLNEDDLLSSSSNVIQSYVDDNNNINSAIDDKLKSIEALLYEK